MDLLFSFFSVNVAHAESLNEFIGHVDKIIVNPVIDLLFAVALVIFLYGVLEFILNQEDETKRTAGKSHMLWGVVGMAIMIGVFGILSFLMNTFGIKGIKPEQGTVQLP